MKVTIKPVDASNWKQVIKLKASFSQKDFLASNERYLAMCSVEKKLVPQAVMLDNQVVGFLCHGFYENNSAEYGITAFMVDKDYQKKGYR